MTRRKKIARRQHYIPQFYLKEFSQDSEHLWVYDKRKGKEGEFRYQTIKDIAFENNFYTHKTIEGRMGDLENLLSRIEAHASQIISKLKLRRSINESDKEKLAVFVSLMYVRVPSFKYKLKESYEKIMEKIMRLTFAITPKEWLKKFYQKQGKNLSDQEIDDLIAFATDENRSKLEVNIPQEYWLKFMLESSVRFAHIFYHMNWQLCYVHKRFAFIVSDNPFLLVPGEEPKFPYGRGLITPKAKKILPLSSNVCLVMHDLNPNPKIWYNDVTDKNFFRQINRWQILNSERFVFSPDRGKLEKMVKKIKPFLIKNQPRIIVG